MLWDLCYLPLGCLERVVYKQHRSFEICGIVLCPLCCVNLLGNEVIQISVLKKVVVNFTWLFFMCKEFNVKQETDNNVIHWMSVLIIYYYIYRITSFRIRFQRWNHSCATIISICYQTRAFYVCVSFPMLLQNSPIFFCIVSTVYAQVRFSASSKVKRNHSRCVSKNWASVHVLRRN